jgi:hypothetical protein
MNSRGRTKPGRSPHRTYSVLIFGVLERASFLSGASKGLIPSAETLEVTGRNPHVGSPDVLMGTERSFLSIIK